MLDQDQQIEKQIERMFFKEREFNVSKRKEITWISFDKEFEIVWFLLMLYALVTFIRGYSVRLENKYLGAEACEFLFS